MDRDIVKLLKKDLNKARKLRDEVNEMDNYGVIKPSYLGPITSNIVLPMNHPDGLFVCLQKMVLVLEKALAYGSIYENPLPADCPRYLTDLLEEVE